MNSLISKKNSQSVKLLRGVFCAAFTILPFLQNQALAKDYSALGLGTYGAGMTPCEAWLENLNSESDYIAQAWVAGAFTGYENACRLVKGNCVGDRVKSMSHVYLGAKAYCRTHPGDHLSDAALDVWSKLVSDPTAF